MKAIIISEPVAISIVQLVHSLNINLFINKLLGNFCRLSHSVLYLHHIKSPPATKWLPVPSELAIFANFVLPCLPVSSVVFEKTFNTRYQDMYSDILCCVFGQYVKSYWSTTNHWMSTCNTISKVIHWDMRWLIIRLCFYFECKHIWNVIYFDIKG